MKKGIWKYILLSTAIIFGGFVFLEKNIFNESPDKKDITLEGRAISVYIADTKKLRKSGLSGYSVLGENEGMLFLFPESEKYTFWMKDMNFALDILWIDEDKTLVEISENISPDTYPQSFAPSVPVRYVLEVPAGWVNRHAIAPGAKIQWE